MRSKQDPQECPHYSCKLIAGQPGVKVCPRVGCGLYWSLSGPDRIARKYFAELREKITPDVLYHAFTGENDIYKLDNMRGMSDHDPRLIQAFKNWPQRLSEQDAKYRKEKQQIKEDVQQFLFNLGQ